MSQPDLYFKVWDLRLGRVVSLKCIKKVSNMGYRWNHEYNEVQNRVVEEAKGQNEELEEV